MGQVGEMGALGVRYQTGDGVPVRGGVSDGDGFPDRGGVPAMGRIPDME